MNLQHIQDRFEIKQLVDHFSNLADEKRVEDQKPLFTENAVVNTYINGELVFEMQGREQIGQVFANYLAGFDKVYHLNGQQTVELDGDSAEGITYCQVALTHENTSIFKWSGWWICLKMALMCCCVSASCTPTM